MVSHLCSPVIWAGVDVKQGSKDWPGMARIVRTPTEKTPNLQRQPYNTSQIVLNQGEISLREDNMGIKKHPYEVLLSFL